MLWLSMVSGHGLSTLEENPLRRNEGQSTTQEQTLLCTTMTGLAFMTTSRRVCLLQELVSKKVVCISLPANCAVWDQKEA